ncbi:peptidoglycan-binding protein [Streptomyces sp. NPDC093591]|uniref:peptidoglycan-binding domain-containing protein n=1 Tax=Streptomyces sp. NPDC093591 TaxID=3366044 RepID=UPI003828F564
MRPNVLTRTVVSLTTVVGLAAGTVAAAGTGFAASQPAAEPAVSSQSITVQAVQNFGLSSQQAKNVQCFLKQDDTAKYRDSIDGKLGTNSWKAFQRFFKKYWDYNDTIDGDPGPNTVMSLQRMLKHGWDYRDRIDGDPGPNTRAAFKRFANDMSVFHPC